MSKNFKPLHAQIADKLIADLKAGTSPLQKPIKDNGESAFIQPVNPITGKNYRGMNALGLAMKGFSDPRWMTANQARFAGFLIEKGAKGSLIDFSKKSDIQAIRTVDNQKIKGDDGKTQTKTVEFDKPVNAQAFVFNAAQVKGFTPLEKFLAEKEKGQQLSPLEQAEKLLTDSKAVIVHGGNEAYYDRAKDEIHLPEREQFENETAYYKAAIHQLAHWTGHESRLNRPMEGKFGSMEYAHEELRATIASMMVGSELKTGHNFGQHAAYSNNWMKILKEEPFEILRASADAQKTADFLLNAGQKREVKQGDAPSMILSKGEEIGYNNTTYKVLDKKGKTLEMEKTDTGEKFKLKPTDKLFGKLVEARNNPVEQKLELAESQEQTHKIGR